VKFRTTHFAVVAIIAGMAFNLPSAFAMGSGANCVSTSGEVSNTGGDGSSCDAKSDGSGTATAKAKGDQGVADAVVENGGTASAKSKKGAFTDAEAQADCIAKARAGGKDGGSESFCTADGASSKAIAHQNAFSEAESDADCVTLAKSFGAHSVASATCSQPGSVNKAFATDGATAEATDTDPPDCDVSGGGHAKVVSSMGNCEK
jgi:hypothetical protein